MSLTQSAPRILARLGNAHTLWRRTQVAGSTDWEAGAETSAFYPCRAHARGYDPRKTQGTLADNESLVIVDAATLAVAPVKGDRIAKGTFTANQAGAVWQEVTAVYAPQVGDARPLYRLRVTG